MEEDSVATRIVLEELKEDLRNRYEAINQKVEMMMEKVKTVEKMLKILSNIYHH